MRHSSADAPPEYLAKLPSMCKQLEFVLYSSARSFEEYADRSTLFKRMQKSTQRIINSFASKDDDRLCPNQVIDLTDAEQAMSNLHF
jgi:hypothetical protein